MVTLWHCESVTFCSTSTTCCRERGERRELKGREIGQHCCVVFVSCCRYDVVRMQRAVAGRAQGIYFAVVERLGFWDAVHFHSCFHSQASGVPAGHESTAVRGQLHRGEWPLWGHASSRNRVFYLRWVSLPCNAELNTGELVGCTSSSNCYGERLPVLVFTALSNHSYCNMFVSMLFNQ